MYTHTLFSGFARNLLNSASRSSFATDPMGHYCSACTGVSAETAGAFTQSSIAQPDWLLICCYLI